MIPLPPPIKVQLRITTSFVEQHRNDYYFLYSDTVQEPSCYGQSSVCSFITHKNCFRVPVRWSLCPTSGFFQDNQLAQIKEALDRLMARIPTDKPVIPFPKIGCGHSRMKERAPKAFEYMMSKINLLKYPNIIYIPAPETTAISENVISTTIL